MSTATETRYTFRELVEEFGTNSQQADKAREFLWGAATDHQWWEWTYTDWKQALKSAGFDNADIMFSGFCSQGDGASFTADVDVPKLIAFLVDRIEGSNTVEVDKDGNEQFRSWVVHKLGYKPECPAAMWLHEYFDEITMQVTRTSSHYLHENACEVDYELTDDLPDTLDAIFSDLLETAEELRKALSRRIYRDLEEEHDYLTSDESFMEDDTYRFDEDGDYVPE